MTDPIRLGVDDWVTEPYDYSRIPGPGPKLRAGLEGERG